MDNQKRTYLWLALAGISFFLISRWVEFNTPKPDLSQQTQVVNQGTNQPNDIPDQQNNNAVPSLPNGNNGITEQSADVKSNPFIHVKTDVLDIQINDRGDIIHAGLITYPESLEKQDVPFSLLGNTATQYFVTQSGLIASKQSANQSSPNHTNAIFTATQDQFILKEGENELIVPLTWTDNAGLTVTKKYIFTRGKFEIGFKKIVDNQSAYPWMGVDYRQLAQSEPPKKNGMMMASSYTGAVYSSPNNTYKKEAFKDIGKLNSLGTNLNEQSKGGWFAMIQHYFIAAWVPGSQTDENIIYTNALKGGSGNYESYIMGMRSAAEVIIAPHTSYTFASTLYLGPKIQKNLASVAPKLELTVDYGWLWYISGFLFKLLVWFHNLIGNWGWSIMLVTLTVKAALYWFAAKGFTSMARMRKFTPELTRLKELYGDDKQKLNQEMMALYRKEKINPMSGCWPMLIQIPIFISLYWMLIESVELRQAPWALWIHDLSLMDPYYILPLIMGATMFIQQRLNPPPPDPMQAKIMMYMPIVFTFMFLWFPAGLVLYWIVNNTISIIQQWYITKRIEAASNKLTPVSLQK